MTELQASRTLVKSPPELWAECSDAAALGRHLDGFGEIRITRLDPETAVAWEGENVRGTVRIEPAGWGTKVILTAEPPAQAIPTTEPVVAVAPADGAPAEVVSAVRWWRFARLRSFLRGPQPLESVPEAEVSEPEPEPSDEPTTEPETGTEAALTAALDSLGQAHHRPYSRA